MKLSEYKELLATNPKLAMLFDLSERFPRGPQANLRPHHYEASSDGWYERHETQLAREAIRSDKKTAGVEEASTVEKHGFCPVAYGYNVLELHAFFKSNHISDGYDFRRSIERLVDTSVGHERTVAEQRIVNQFLGYSKQATRTRRAKRIYLRIQQLKRWVEKNVTTAYYKIYMSHSLGTVFVHADSELAAQSQYDLFIKPAIADYEKKSQRRSYGRDDHGNYHVRYDRHALEGPTGLMQMNQAFSSKADESIASMEEQVAQLQQRIAALTTAKQMIETYSANMTCSYDYEETA